MRTKPFLRRCLSRCQHCGIFFLTDPRNVKREDLGCPFGCRQAHRKRRSTERSVAYYRTRVGKIKKRLQNGKRQLGRPAEQGRRPAEEKEPLPGVGFDGFRFESGMVSYLRMATSLIEGRRVGLTEILEMLVRVLRQHSMAPGRGRDYGTCQSNRDPP